MNSGHEFLLTLAKTAAFSGSPQELARLSQQVIDAALNFGSETPDNLKIREYLSIEPQQRAFDGSSHSTLVVRGKAGAISDVIYACEDDPAWTALMRSRFPELNESECEAIQRMIMLILLAISAEGNKWPESK